MLIPLQMRAQTLTNAETRRMNKRLLDMVQTYEAVASVYDENSYYTLLGLCQDGESLVYSDMMDYAFGQMLKASEYIDLLSKKRNVSIQLKNVRKKSITYEQDGWHLIAVFNKAMSYTDDNGVLFSSSEYFGTDYSMTLECVYTPQDDNCYIKSIKGVIHSQVTPLTETGFVVVNKNSLDKKNRWGLTYNSFDQALVPRGVIQPWNNDIHIVADTLARGDNYEMINLSHRTTHMRVKPRFAYAVGGVYKVTSGMPLDENESSGFEFGADLGCTVPMGSSSTIGLFVGAAISSTKLQVGVTKPIIYSYRTIDASNKKYTRQYNISSIREGVSYLDFVFPAYLNFEHKLVKELYLSWHLGAKVYLNGMTTVNPYRLTGNVEAIYDNDVVINSINGTYTEFMNPNSYNRNEIDYSAVAGLNLSYNIYRRRLLVYADFSYEYGLTSIHSSDENALYNENTKQYPIIYSARLNKNIATRSFMDCISYKRRTMWLELGVMYKF